MERASEFLDLYKNIEEELQMRYMKSSGKRIVNPIMHFMNSQEGKRYREELNLCREVRNILSHHARFEGEDVVEPSGRLVEFLRGLLDYLENPPDAERIFTPIASLMCATREDRLLDAFAQMEKRGFSHLPVLENGRLYGVLSIGTVFIHFKSHPDVPLGREARVADLWQELPIDRHANERFAFVRPDCSYERMRTLFAEGGPKKKRLAALFVTKDGRANSRLLGMITPWDMLRVKEF